MIVYSNQAISVLKKTCFAGVKFECLLIYSTYFTEILPVLLEKLGKHTEQKILLPPLLIYLSPMIHNFPSSLNFRPPVLYP
jgi:hypothetical protein